MINYGFYQGERNTDGTPTNTPAEQERNTDEYTDGTSTNTPTELNKNVKNVKNEKNLNIYSPAEPPKWKPEIDEIIEYLNYVCNKKYKATTDSTVKHISARLNEGYTVVDFKQVIDTKADEWKGTNMEKYLRPDTLFLPSKFESYLNQRPRVEPNDDKPKYQSAEGLIDFTYEFH